MKKLGYIEKYKLQRQQRSPEESGCYILHPKAAL